MSRLRLVNEPLTAAQRAAQAQAEADLLVADMVREFVATFALASRQLEDLAAAKSRLPGVASMVAELRPQVQRYQAVAQAVADKQGRL